MGRQAGQAAAAGALTGAHCRTMHMKKGAARRLFSSSRRTPESMSPLPWQSECTRRIKMGPSVRWDDGKHHYLRRSGLLIGQLDLQRGEPLDCHRRVDGPAASTWKRRREAPFRHPGERRDPCCLCRGSRSAHAGSRWIPACVNGTTAAHPSPRRSGLLTRPAWPSAPPAAWLRPATWPAGRADRLPSRRRRLRRPTHGRGSWPPRS